MHFDEYQRKAKETAVYPELIGQTYTILGLAGETGEVCELVKKQLRDYEGNLYETVFQDRLMKELGDVLWYLAMICEEYDLSLNDIAHRNLEKLQERKNKGTIHGEGSER